MANLRAGLIGLGMMGRHHARNLRALDGVDLVGVADAAGDPHGVAGGLKVLGSIEELIEVGLDYCVVALPTEQHLSAGLALAQAGVHALLEKPAAKTQDEAIALVEAFTSRNLVGAVGHIERYNASLQQLRARLDAGDLGDIYQIATRRQGPFPNRIADVGVIKDLASHDIDSTAWVSRSRYLTVSAQVMFKSGRVHEDMVASTCLLENHIMTNHLVNWLTPTKERLTIVTGEKGMFVADTLTADLTFYANGSVDTEWDDIAQFRGVSEGQFTRFAFAKPEPLRIEHEQFRDAVLGLAADIVTIEEGARVVSVCEAMIDSARQGATVRL